MTSDRRPSDAGSDDALVVLRFPAASGVPRVELRSELTHFYDPIALLPSGHGDGHLSVTMRAPVGIYRYKFRGADGHWHLDPANLRTRARDGQQDSLLCVSGTEEPVLHAPAPSYCFLRDDGRLCLRAALRRGHGDRLSVRVLEDGHGDLPMQVVGTEDEHLLFEVAVPVSQRALDYLFVLSSGHLVGAAGSGASLRVRLRDLRARTPAWWRDAVLYTIFVDRFRRGDSDAPWPPVLAGEEDRAGGDLRGIQAALPYLRDLGVTALHLTPLSMSASAHRYDASDPRRVDPALGGEAAVAMLLEAAHAAGLRVLLDLALTHVHRDFFAFADVRRRGFQSPYAPWFRLRRFPFAEGSPAPGYEHYQKGRWQEPLLDLSCEDVISYLEETLQGYARLGIDGLRIDAAADLPPRVLRRLCRAVRQVHPDLLLLGEVIPHNGARYLAEGLDAVTDFAAQQILYRWLWRREATGQTTAAALAQRCFDRGGPGWRGVFFTATHDQHRLLSLTGDARIARLAHLYLLTRPEVPALYYGDEIGLRCATAPRDFEGAWPDRQPMPWDPAAWDGETLALLRAAIALRRQQPALRHGDDQWLPAPGMVLAYRRSEPGGGAVIDVWLNGGPDPVSLPQAAGAPSGATVLLACGAVTLNPEGALELGPYAGVVLQRHPPADLSALWVQIRGDNRALARSAFAAGVVELPTLPTHLYITVTEACNLRCRHCITDAPARTREGRARTLRPWLLTALREGLASADYFGFVHGGESLVAPELWELLAAIQTAHAGRRYDAHLLTNGMLLDEDTVRRLAQAGVNSVAVSLDGASATTNDHIRAGARMETILANLRAALRLRRTEALDLRIGVSTVVTAGNLAELAALGRLCVELGVDWLKVEELAPVNGFARLQQIDRSPALLTEVMSALRREAEAAAGGLVVVDHLHPPPGCRCQGLSAAETAFRDADDFANRARFAPCRALWEQACVDPDGTVRAVDYHHASLGRLDGASLLSLWSGAEAQRQRLTALRKLPAAQRERCAASVR